MMQDRQLNEGSLDTQQPPAKVQEEQPVYETHQKTEQIMKQTWTQQRGTSKATKRVVVSPAPTTLSTKASPLVGDPLKGSPLHSKNGPFTTAAGDAAPSTYHLRALKPQDLGNAVLGQDADTSKAMHALDDGWTSSRASPDRTEQEAFSAMKEHPEEYSGPESREMRRAEAQDEIAHQDSLTAESCDEPRKEGENQSVFVSIEADRGGDPTQTAAATGIESSEAKSKQEDPGRVSAATQEHALLEGGKLGWLRTLESFKSQEWQPNNVYEGATAWQSFTETLPDQLIEVTSEEQTSSSADSPLARADHLQPLALHQTQAELETEASQKDVGSHANQLMAGTVQHREAWNLQAQQTGPARELQPSAGIMHASASGYADPNEVNGISEMGWTMTEERNEESDMSRTSPFTLGTAQLSSTQQSNLGSASSGSGTIYLSETSRRRARARQPRFMYARRPENAEAESADILGRPLSAGPAKEASQVAHSVLFDVRLCSCMLTHISLPHPHHNHAELRSTP